MTKPFKYLVIGLIIDFLVLLIGGTWLVVTVALNYNGRCGVFWFFGGQGRPCPLLEYMKEELSFALILIVFELWWVILPALVVLPVVGYLFGRHRNRFNST